MRETTTFTDHVREVIDGLPTSQLIDRGVVVDALLDLFGPAGEANGERVTNALRDLPPAGLLERDTATGVLLELLDPSAN